MHSPQCTVGGVNVGNLQGLLQTSGRERGREQHLTQGAGFSCLPTIRCAVKITALNVQPQASPTAPSSLLSHSSSCCCPHLSGERKGAATPQFCSVDRTRKSMCGPNPSSPRALQVAVAGSLIKATLLMLTHGFPLPSCPFPQPSSCTKSLFPGLQCRPKAVSYI